jgi:5-methylcytosine-specific restriction protein B
MTFPGVEDTEAAFHTLVKWAESAPATSTRLRTNLAGVVVLTSLAEDRGGITTTSVTERCEQLFGVRADVECIGYCNPFVPRLLRRTKKSNWAISTIWTRMGEMERRDWLEMEDGLPRRFKLRPELAKAFHDKFAAHKVPAHALAAVCAANHPDAGSWWNSAGQFQAAEFRKALLLTEAKLDGIFDWTASTLTKGQRKPIVAADFASLAGTYCPLQEEAADDDAPATLPAATTEQPSLTASASQLCDEIVSALMLYRNVVLQGPPGTGKTMIARVVGETLASSPAGGHCEHVQFHQSFSYDDFVQGFRPSAETAGAFQLQDGAFLRICRLAASNPSSNYVMVIDEINRGNISQVFGELLQLIDASKRNSASALRLLHSRDNEGPFFVPPNVFLIGTMNTADRSIALVDFALRRRFRFYDVDPDFGPDFIVLLTGSGVPKARAEEIAERMNSLNATISKDRRYLGPGHQIGHAYWIPNSPIPTDDDGAARDWIEGVIEGQIAPLLREYWHDRPETAAREINALLPS